MDNKNLWKKIPISEVNIVQEKFENNVLKLKATPLNYEEDNLKKVEFKVTDAELLSSKLKEHAINFNDSLDPITWIFDLLRASSQDLDLELFGLELLPDHRTFSLSSIKDEINNELFELSQAHFDRYFTN